MRATAITMGMVTGMGIIITTTTTMTDRGSVFAVYRLAVWLSPAFPVGAYTYSSGLEYAVEAGLVGNRDDLQDWIATQLRIGQGRLDADFFRDAYGAAAMETLDGLGPVVELADAMRGTSELALESAAQGAAFLTAVRAAWPHERLEAFADLLALLDRKPAYSVAVGVTAAVHGVALRDALVAYLHATAANLVSAGVRLVPLGQTDGQRATAALEPVVLAAADAALRRSPDDMGAATPMIDWTSMQHETQYTRLFRS